MPKPSSAVVPGAAPSPAPAPSYCGSQILASMTSAPRRTQWAVSGDHKGFILNNESGRLAA